jgi:phosphatidylglycerol:prolipoprotein diacylglycerol transferase
MIDFFPTRQIAFEIGFIAIHWYGILYALAFLTGILLLPKLLKKAKIDLTLSERESLVLAIFLGVLVGGRLGFVLFYGGSYFLDNPLKIFAVWEGGMSSHGGFIGVILAVFLFSRRKHVDLFRLADVLVIPVALGLAFGRLGNLINGELYGTITTLPWGMHFPGVEGLRHPTQIYAILKDLLIAGICYVHFSHLIIKKAPSGETTALFLILYGVLRFIVEIFRDQSYGYEHIVGLMFSRGQLLTIPIVLAGVGIWYMRRRIRN